MNGWLPDGADKALIAGALGGLVRWITLREHWRDGAISIVVGALCSLYLAPLGEPFIALLLRWLGLAPVLDLAPDQQAGFAGFVVGVGGIGIVGFILDFIKAKRRQNGGGK